MSWRGVITLVGTVVGAFLGSPGLGFACGSMLGDTITPAQIVITDEPA